MILPSRILVACLAAVGATAAEPEFVFGANTHRGAEADYLPVLAQMGVTSLRDHAVWKWCEGKPGTIEVPAGYLAFVDRAKANGIDLLDILCYGNPAYDDGGYPRSPEAIAGYVRYAEAVVTALKGRCTRYQIWNEWDGGCGMADALKGTGDAKAYLALLAAVYPKIKAIDPDATVIANSVCTGDAFLQQTLDLGVLQHCDAVALHTYNYSRERTAEAWHQRMAGVDAMLRKANGGKPVPLYLTEMGWPTHVARSGSTAETESVQLQRLYLLARTLPYIQGIWWYDYRDDGWDAAYNENNFGLVRNDLTPKPGYFAMRDVSRALRGAAFEARIDAGDPDIWALRFRAADGKALIALWSAHPDDDWQLHCTVPAGAAAAVALTCPGQGTVQRSLKAGAKPDAPATFDVTVRERPVLLSGDLAGLALAKVEKRPFPEADRPAPRRSLPPPLIARAVPVAAAAVPAYRCGGWRALVPAAAKLADGDLAAGFTARWDASGLRLRVAVDDDTFRQEGSGDRTWMGDGLQLAFHPADAAPNVHVDLDVALTAAGPQVFRRRAAGDGAATAITAAIARDGKRVDYDLTIPWAEIGLAAAPAPGTTLGFAVVVNDDDGGGRKGYLRWGDGIAQDKDPAAYGWLLFEE